MPELKVKGASLDRMGSLRGWYSHSIEVGGVVGVDSGLEKRHTRVLEVYEGGIHSKFEAATPCEIQAGQEITPKLGNMQNAS